MLGAVDRPVPAARAAKRHAERGETTAKVALHGTVGQRICRLKKAPGVGAAVKKPYHRGIHAGKVSVLFITPRIVKGATIEHKAAAVAGTVLRQTFFCTKNWSLSLQDRQQRQAHRLC